MTLLKSLAFAIGFPAFGMRFKLLAQDQKPGRSFMAVLAIDQGAASSRAIFRNAL